MTDALSHYKNVYLELKLWARLAIPIALVLFVLYIVLGFQFWRAAGQKATLESEVSELSNLALLTGPSADALSEVLALRQEELTEYKGKLDQVSPHILLEEVYAESAFSSIDLQSVSFGDQREVTSGDTVFMVQPVALTIQGSWENLRLFLSGVQLRRPALSVGDIRASDLNTIPIVQLQLAFYLSANEKGN